MPVKQTQKKIRKSFFVDPAMVARAKRILGVPTEAEAIRLLLEQTVEQDRFWRFMEKTAGSLKENSFSL